MKYLLAPIAALIAGCAVMQPHPKKKAEPLGCRPSGADILLSGEVAKRDMLLCFNPDGTVEWKLGQQKPVEPALTSDTVKVKAKPVTPKK